MTVNQVVEHTQHVKKPFFFDKILTFLILSHIFTIIYFKNDTYLTFVLSLFFRYFEIRHLAKFDESHEI
jgi:hypothetical protein